MNTRCLAVVIRQVAKDLSNLSKRRHFVLNDKIGHARLTMNARPPQFIRGYILPQHRLNDARARETKKGVFGLNKEATLARQITTTAGIKAKHAHNARHNAGDFTKPSKGFSVAIQAANACGNIGTC